MWIQLVQAKNTSISGKYIRAEAGDWIDVGKQTALMWIADGSAQIPEALDFTHISGELSGIATDDRELLTKRTSQFQDVKIEEMTKPTLIWDRTAWIDSALELRPELLPIGFGMLDTWQIAVPLYDYKVLAYHYGEEGEREKTKQVVRDLRCLMYDTRLVFARNDTECNQVFDLWNKEGGGMLAFLRAIYTVKPFILALPSTWTLGRPKRD